MFKVSPFLQGCALACVAAVAALLGASRAVAADSTTDSDPLSRLTIYIVPHSHVDLGYTELQTDIEDKQVDNILAGIAAARRTADNPEGARFVYNLEGTWAADLLLRRLNAAQQADFVAAARAGQVSVNGMFTNTLTGLCRPEELIRLFGGATELRALTGTPVDTAMVSDLPAVIWGTVPALAHAGIRYLSIAPNHRARLGGIHDNWDDKPFWWVGPSAGDRVLVWLPTWGYGLSMNAKRLSESWVNGYVQDLRRAGYRYDVSYVRWAGTGDNAVPDASICEFVKTWNAAHAWPRLVIASAHDAFVALEKKYGDALPVVRGDMTPFWEDGAGSTARETAMSRANSDRFSQAEALWALHSPATYPTRDFNDAMRLLLLYDEHSWGADSCVSDPIGRPSVQQWSLKQAYAGAADFHTRDLLSRSLALVRTAARVDGVDIFNTTSWPRTEVVILPSHLAADGESVTDEQGNPVPSQRLAHRELAVLARDVPAFGSRRLLIRQGTAHVHDRVSVSETTIDNGHLVVRLDSRTGDIVELRAKGIEGNLVDTGSGGALNQYLYFTGVDPTTARSSGPVTVRIKDKGPLVASIEVESSAPGCVTLRREVSLAAGADHVEITDVVDKARLVAPSYFHVVEGKESVNFSFPFNVPGGQVRLEVPFGIVRPDADQMAGANKNWFSIDRWADVSNGDFGVTWVSLDAPLVQVGGLTANIVSAQGNKIVWRDQVGPTQKLYAWVMNNHWNTNYPAYQQGVATFRFQLRPHHAYDAAAASRFAFGASQPLLAARACDPRPASGPRLTFDTSDLIVTGLKPSDDGRAVIVRVWNATPNPLRSSLRWSAPMPRQVSLSDTTEAALKTLSGALEVPAWGVATLRADLP